MMKAWIFKGIFALIDLISRLPFWLLHGVADVLYILIYYVVGYRKKMVYSNLKKSFPLKSDDELKKISKKFYHHFADLIIESIKSSTMSQKEFIKRYDIINWEILLSILKQGESVIVVSPHTGNWEWVFSLVSRIPCKVLAIYQKLSNEHFDKYIKSTRQRYGAVMVPRKETYAQVLGAIEKKEQTLSWFAADQACAPDKAIMVDFLGQETTFHAGYEILARQTGQRVLFLDIKKVKRSCYRLELTEICSDSANAERGEIVKKFAALTEKRILADPPFWLWSHNKWKHQKKDV